MKTIGITGGIGSGKTTVCKFWESQGARVIDADKLAKEVMITNKDLIAAIKKEFGEESYLKNGSLNRAFLAKQAFEQNKVEILNQLVHPEVYREMDIIKGKAEKEGVEVLVREAALLLQKGRPKNLDYVVLVLAAKDLRKERVTARDQASPEQVEGRMMRQQNFMELTDLADFVITNEGSLQDLLVQAEEVYCTITG